MSSIPRVLTRSGVGLRLPHIEEAVATRPPAGWFEIHPENFLANPHATELLQQLAADYPISVHTVGLSVGSAHGVDRVHLRRLRQFIDRIDPVLVSGHLAWSTHQGEYLNDLLPLPYTEEALAHVVSRVGEVQDYLRRPLLIENVSSYLEFADSTIPEWEFVRELSQRAGCQILLDVNNIHVNAVNHDFDPFAYVDAIAVGSVGEIHLAGFQDTGDILIDTHGATVSDAVWRLYAHAIARFGPVPTLVEWDTDIPALPVLLAEAAKADRILDAAQEGANHAG